MRSEGSRFTLGVWGQGCVRQMLRLCPQPSAAVRNRLCVWVFVCLCVCVTAVRPSLFGNESGAASKVCQVDP